MKSEKGYVMVSLYDIWNSLDTESKEDFIENIIYQEDVSSKLIDELIDVLIDDTVVTKSFNGWIYNGRTKILEKLGLLQAKHFSSLLHELNQAMLDAKRWNKEYSAIYDELRQLREEYGIPYKSLPQIPYENAGWVRIEDIAKYFKSED
jgi:hypothetical protein